MEFFFRNIEDSQNLGHVHILDVVEPTPVDPIQESNLPDVVEENADTNLDVALPFVLLLCSDVGTPTHGSLAKPADLVLLSTEHELGRLVVQHAVKQLLQVH